ncbi:LON peptidase substrate-binding domain-containing protein [Coralliovum pocilloporae]|uniref:LON peptidase substrate-binding domain-containing protein n=1 Tax=Coralliovum pocilloporae TaxID=3066369 RepID=UPI003307A832
MQIGNATYDSAEDLPDVIPVFPLESALLLPRGHLPLNIFEPRYVNMLDHALSTERLIGMVQPALSGSSQAKAARADEPDLCQIGCVGRITAYQEAGDGTYQIDLTGIARFEILREMPSLSAFRLCQISTGRFGTDFETDTDDEGAVDRSELLRTFRSYLDANNLETDWNGVEQARTETLVNALSIMAPYGSAEKQALLEAETLKMRADTLIAMTEVVLSRMDSDQPSTLQ